MSFQQDHYTTGFVWVCYLKLTPKKKDFRKIKEFFFQDSDIWIPLE